MRQSRVDRIARLALTLVALVVLSGCAYMQHRGDDAKDLVDIGVTWSKKPYGSASACLLGLGSIGAGRLDGKFAGLGGSRFGTTRHFHRTLGTVAWCYDEVGWGEFDPADPDSLDRYYTGLVGWPKYPQRRPQYGFA